MFGLDMDVADRMAVVGTVGVARAMPFDNSGLRILVSLPMGLLVLVGLIAFVSARLTFHDAPQTAQRSPTLTLRVIRLPVTLFGTLVLVLVGAAGISSLPYLGGIHMRSTARPLGAVEFGGSPFIGGYGMLFDALIDAPSGSQRLRGRIALQGVGIPGARISLVLNDQYEAQRLTSDSRGVFEASLPAGKWRVTRFKSVATITTG